MNWRLLQTGVGIDLREDAFRAVCVKRQWNRSRVADYLEIPEYRRQGAEACGRQYRQFLRKNGLKMPPTVVALPRSQVLLRTLIFPRAVERELARAVAFELDGLHPFGEGSVVWDFAVVQPEAAAQAAKDKLHVIVAIAEKTVIDDLSGWFEQAGITVSQFTVSGALLFAMLESPAATKPRAAELFLLNASAPASGIEIELVAGAPGMAPVFKEIPIPEVDAAAIDHRLPAAVERELASARAELRLDPETHPALIVCGRGGPEDEALRDLPFAVSSMEEIFPEHAGQAKTFDLRANAVSFAAALTAADQTLPLSFNLLPRERRSYQSPLAYLPTYALSALVVLLAVVLGLRGSFQDWLYSRYLESQIQGLRPKLEQVEAAQQRQHSAAERVAQLARFRDTAAVPLDILDELTRLLPSDVWLTGVQLEGGTLSLYGEAQSASGLLPLLSNSEFFEKPQFLSAINRNESGKENFRIAARLRGTIP